MVRGEGIGNRREAWAAEFIDKFTTVPLVRRAFRHVDRAAFAPRKYRKSAYTDEIIDLGEGSSISQPSLVARMVNLLELSGNEKVLEIGTASGYNAAVLSMCAREVVTVEYNRRLAGIAEKRLERFGYENVKVVTGDGALGFKDQAPYDRIIVTAAAREIPGELIRQLKVGGIIVLPVGKDMFAYKSLVVGIKTQNFLVFQNTLRVRFHPLISNAHGGWTEELALALFEGKKQFVLEHRNPELLREKVHNSMGIEIKDIDPESLIRYVDLTDEEFAQYVPSQETCLDRIDKVVR